MIKSEPILPLRFYDDIFNQERFNFLKERNDCDSLLVYPTNVLPSFQFKRDTSLAIIDEFYLRKVCDEENNYKLIPEAASNFSDTDTADFFGVTFPLNNITAYNVFERPIYGNKPTVKIDCNQLKQVDEDIIDCNPAFTQLKVDTEVGKTYKIKLIVEHFIQGPSSSFMIELYDGVTSSGGVSIQQITSNGIYNITYEATTAGLLLLFKDFECDDEFTVSYFQVTEDNFENPTVTDIEINSVNLLIVPMKDGTDILVYCDDLTSYQIPPAKYYYVVVDTDGNKFFSETFDIVSLKEIEKYYRLTWYSTCDLFNKVLYSSSLLPCSIFKNILYLDAALFNPKYDLEEEVNKNGEGTEIPEFKRWQKTRVLDIIGTEFMADAISGIFLHETVLLREPLNRFQEFENTDIVIEKTIPEITSIVQDRLLRVQLTLLLGDKFVDINCCDPAETQDCNPERYIAVNSCGGGDDYELRLTNPPASGDGLYDCSDNLIVVDEDDIILNTDTGLYYKLKLIAGIWTPYVIRPYITDVATTATHYVTTITAFPYSWVEILSNKDAAGYISRGTFYVGSTGSVSIQLLKTLFTGATDLKFQAENASLYCDFGTSNEYDVV